MMDVTKIKLDDKSLDKVCETITSYVSEFSKQSGTDCIYYAPYQHNYHGCYGNPIIALTILSNNIDDNLRKRVEELNNGATLKHNAGAGARVIIRLDDSIDYAFNPTNERNNKKLSRLYNSSILYDRAGIYTRLQTWISNCDAANLLNFNPNIRRLENEIKIYKK
ncbi:MAG: hypothetical protein IJ565_04900 [Bacilli bacterium]|nr:hypothetical protein [Bacilli bacterium]